MNRARRWVPLVTALVCMAASAGCGALPWKRKAPAVAVEAIAVLPLERAEAESESARVSDAPRLAPGAERVVTAQVYGELVERSRWRVVPDLVVAEALRGRGAGGSLEDRARAVGRAARADAVLCGGVSRFVERVGSEMGARSPASVSLELRLVHVESGEVLWRGAFDETQQPLSSNLLNWWMFWRGGPRWFSAAELARLGAGKLIDDLEDR